MRAALLASFVGWSTIAASVFSPVPAAAQAFAECEALVHAAPDDYLSYRCYRSVALKTGRFEQAAEGLWELHRRAPDNHYATAYLARIQSDRGQLVETEQLFRRAADGYTQDGNAVGEAFLRLDFSYFLAVQLSKLDEAETQLTRVGQLVDAHPLLAPWLAVRASSLASLRLDHGRALRLLRGVESQVFSSGQLPLQQVWLSNLGYTEWILGRLEAATRSYEREAELLRASGLLHQEAIPRRNLAFLAIVGGADRSTGLELAEAALDVATRGNNRAVQAMALSDLSFLAVGEARIDLARDSLALARTLGSDTLVRRALRGLAAALADADPDGALAVANESITLAERSHDLAEVVRGQMARAAVLRRSGAHEIAVRASLAALDSAEATRSLQADPEIRARYFGTWATGYYDLATYLLRYDSPYPSRDVVSQAMEVMERMRARTLLDELEAARAVVPRPSSEALIGQRRELLRRIAAVQRGLIGPDTPDRDRMRLQGQLRDLELDEARLREVLAREDPAFGLMKPQRLASLTELQQALDEDQAMLLFHLGPPDRRSEAEPWLLALTRSEARVFELPSLRRLGTAIQLFNGLLERADGSESGASVRLYRDLLEKPLEQVGAHVRRLVIVPDRALYLLPFEVLRPQVAGTPIGARYAISIAPSATVWLELRDRLPRERGGDALVVADPDLGNPGPPQRRTEPRSAGFDYSSLGPLPFAAREAASITRYLGEGSRLLVGAEATEETFKRQDLHSFSILHFATHALVDLAEPRRSGIVLAADRVVEDGLLQVRELADLNLDGQLVVLSGCRTAEGPVLIGEGPLSLARPFLLAGASTVVGSLWPLEDQAAAALSDRFYRHLVRGASVSQAMSSARYDLYREGSPARAWAGVVVLGDGDRVFFPPAKSTLGGGWFWLVLGFGLAALFFCGWAMTRARRLAA